MPGPAGRWGVTMAEDAFFDAAAVLARLDRSEARSDRLREGNAALRARLHRLDPRPAGSGGGGADQGSRLGMGRRQALRAGLAAATAATASAVMLGSQPAAADNGDALIVG